MKKEDLQKALFIIDGSSFLYRAYFAIRPLHAPDGRAVHAVYGFCRMIKKLIDQFDPKRMVVVFDSPGKTARHEVYSEYKEKRQAPPGDLIEQKELILDFAEAIALPILMESGVEADDLMYSLALQVKKKGIPSVVISSDKDMRQLVDEDMIIFDPFKDDFLDKKALEERYGFPVEKLPFYFALVGDASDNIPGVKGVGDKKATELVKRFASLDDLYKNIATIQGAALQKNLVEDEANAYMSYELFLLRRQPLDITLAETKFDKKKWSGARALFEELNFKTLLKGLPPAQEEFVPLSEREKYQFITISREEQLDELCVLIQKKKLFAIDTETDGLRPLQNKLVGISICVEKGISYYIPFGHKSGAQLGEQKVLSSLKPLLEDSDIKKYMHSAKFDWLVLYASGIETKGIIFDTMVAASLLTVDGQRLSLKSLSKQYLQQTMLTYDMLIKMDSFKTFDDVPLDLATEYAASDAHQTFLLAQVLEKDLKLEKSLYKLYQEIEHPLITVLSYMEAAGIYLDVAELAMLDKHVTKKLFELREAIIDLAGPKYETINLNSPRQLEELLFQHLKLNPLKKTVGKTGYSTDQEVLQELALQHPIPKLITHYRELFKLKSTYIDALPNYVNPKTGRVHTTFNQTSVATGRLSSSDPNLQNIPVESGKKVTIRSAFEPAKGYQFIAADYSQIELRVLAYLSQDEALLKAFERGYDIHAETAARLFDVPQAEVTHEQRQIGKRINFSILYGLTPYGLSRELHIPYREAEHYIQKYFAQYPGVAQWMDDIVDFAKKKGYVQTLWGRRRFVPGIYERNRTAFEAAKRVAVNTVGQGTAAEVMKLGMIKLFATLKDQHLDCKILLQIHDELLLSVKSEEVQDAAMLINQTLSSVVDWNVPLEVLVSTGKNWQEVTK